MEKVQKAQYRNNTGLPCPLDMPSDTVSLSSPNLSSVVLMEVSLLRHD